MGLGSAIIFRCAHSPRRNRTIVHHACAGWRHVAPRYLRFEAGCAFRHSYHIQLDCTKVPGIRICEHLPRVAQQMDKFAILRSVWGRTAIHFNGVYFLMTGYLPIQSMEFPSMGAVVAKELGLRKGMPPYVLNAMLDHAMGPGFLGSAYAPFWCVPTRMRRTFGWRTWNCRLCRLENISDRRPW